MTFLINSLQRISHPIEESRRSRHTITNYYIIIGSKAIKNYSRFTYVIYTSHYIFVCPYIYRESIYLYSIFSSTRSRYSLMIVFAIFNRLTSYITRSNIIRDKSIVTDNVALLCRMPESIVVSWLQITHISDILPHVHFT